LIHFISQYFSFSVGNRKQQRGPDLRARLAVNGIDFLEERIHPSGTPNLGVSADVRSYGLQNQASITNPTATAANQNGVAQATTNASSSSKPPVSDGTASISGVAFIDYNHDGLQELGDNADAAILVTLSGVDDQNTVVNVTVQVNDDGTFAFTGLRAGTYSLSFVSVFNETGVAEVGSAGGTQSSTSINNIVLTGSTQATGYNFAVAPMAV